jgi:hypothetical protein
MTSPMTALSYSPERSLFGADEAHVGFVNLLFVLLLLGGSDDGGRRSAVCGRLLLLLLLLGRLALAFALGLLRCRLLVRGSVSLLLLLLSAVGAN